MSQVFIHRPIFDSVISIIIVIAGLVSFGGLPVEKFPPSRHPPFRFPLSTQVPMRKRLPKQWLLR